jgi:chlorinating enzyme
MKEFQENGIVFPVQAISSSEASSLVPEFYALANRMGDWTEGPQIPKSHLVSTWVCELVHNNAVLDVVENLIGPDILCWAATFFAKEPQTDGYVGWHQDIHYWGLEPAEQVVTAWLGLTDAHRDNGGMFCIPGSHQKGDRDHQQYPDSDNMLLGSQEVDISEEELSRSIPVDLEPGQFSVHHARLLHGSYGNLSRRPRIGLSINYISTAVAQRANGGRDSAMLVRGNDSFGNFSLESRPEADFDQASLSVYKTALLTPSGIGGADDNIYNKQPDLGRIC